MSQVTSLIRRFHEDREGSNSLEQIVIFALGVLVLGGAWYVWKNLDFGGGRSGLFDVLTQTLKDMFNWTFQS